MPTHPSAIIHESAKIHKSAEISAYAVIGANVEIGAGTVIDSHAVIEGPTKIGKNNHIYSSHPKSNLACLFLSIQNLIPEKKYLHQSCGVF